MIQKELPEMELPTSVKTTYFVRPGVPITLSANQNYYKQYKEATQYYHHGVNPYRFLLREYFEGLPNLEK